LDAVEVPGAEPAPNTDGDGACGFRASPPLIVVLFGALAEAEASPVGAKLAIGGGLPARPFCAFY